MISVIKVLVEYDEIVSNPYDNVTELSKNDGGKQDSDELKKVSGMSKVAQKQNQENNRNIQ
jgi:hypothetical protein